MDADSVNIYELVKCGLLLSIRTHTPPRGSMTTTESFTLGFLSLACFIPILWAVFMHSEVYWRFRLSYPMTLVVGFLLHAVELRKTRIYDGVRDGTNTFYSG
jgi:hypothetical protein